MNLPTLSRGLLVTVAVGMAAACQSTPQPILVRGDSGSMEALAGVWRGEYSSGITGRTGTIEFRLEMGQDTAFGEVVMFPAEEPVPSQNPQEMNFGAFPEALRVNFVRAEQGWVEGTLARYRDPHCGCTLHTVFRGRVDGDVIDGEFESLHEQSGERVSGHWLVRREKAAND